ncbi:WD40 repeat-like protein [Dimargaris xerosporica]|nr:WD40 repeat-like protein [Dimargaris xerosporica]
MASSLQHLYAPQPPTTRGQAVRLHAAPDGTQMVYANGRSIFVRSLEHPEQAWEYVGHRSTTTVAQFAPSGYYVASGDASGLVRIWDATQPDHLLKHETQVLSGRINDLAWDAESKRIMAVGDGKDRFGHCFLFDSGNSVGQVSGHSKVVNACAMRPSGRPFRAVTASDDGTVVFYHGAPYKLQRAIQDHTGFVNDVRYSPDGQFFASVGADQAIYVYDGKTGDQVTRLHHPDHNHTRSIYAVAWAPNSQQLLTSAGDCTAKLWDLEAQQTVHTFTFAHYQSHLDQQLGNLWAGSHLVSLGLSGDLHYLDPKAGTVTRTLHGHQRAITASTMTPAQTLFTGSYDGRVCQWTLADEAARVPLPVKGTGHTSQIIALASSADHVVSAGMDDTLRTITVSAQAFSHTAVPLDSQPKQVAMLPKGRALALTQTNDVLLLSADGQVLHRLAVPDEPSALDVSALGGRVLLGFANHHARIYTLEEDQLVLDLELCQGRAPITAVRFSPNGDLAAVADGQGKIHAYSTKDGSLSISHWVFHTARVNALEWRSDSLFLASGSLDSNAYVWSVQKPMKRIAVKGADGAVKIWALEYPQ